ncbi:glycosyltransferase [Gordonia sp. ABSL1-1]|uniref:nucleotide disphospho-sugar-binding domain-containing protein n=1 Tax=Gordonia sp. ABSL1-1 TaxID=3053923 RepID=UPI0025742CE3|nr:nucleotide disphospho-sugar-binding domain-containing protein [Gordonia sp. ABSL1-1]MDL9935710.1 glycosyltransferase [Gordonia sp. ABSL1-1]
MRIAFALHGSRGDVQPALAVAAALDARGHRVSIAVAADLVEMIERTGLPTRTLCPSTAELLATPLVAERLKSANPRTRMQALREVGSYGSAMSEQVMGELADESDVLVTGLLAQERAATIAESRGIGFIPLHYCPVRANAAVSPTYRRLPRPARAALWSVVDHGYWLSTRGDDRALRVRLGLPVADQPLGRRLRSAGRPEVQAYDPALFDGLATEWGDQRPFSGFLVPDDMTRRALNGDDTATIDAIAWADTGPPPVYVGFGSMPVPAARIGSIVGHLRARGLRVIAHTTHHITEGDGGTDDAVLAVGTGLDHERLLPHCHGAVHHGGAGTTAAAARAGIPSVIGWFSADQPMWAGALARAGAGRGARLTRLAPTDLDALTDPAVIVAARTLARRLVPVAEARDTVCRVMLESA